jgi:ABC-type lipoprotein release transport system permease subunit
MYPSGRSRFKLKPGRTELFVVRQNSFGCAARYPLVFATAVALLVGMAMAAAFFPARRASRIDPLVALRHE